MLVLLKVGISKRQGWEGTLGDRERSRTRIQGDGQRGWRGQMSEAQCGLEWSLSPFLQGQAMVANAPSSAHLS